MKIRLRKVLLASSLTLVAYFGLYFACVRTDSFESHDQLVPMPGYTPFDGVFVQAAFGLAHVIDAAYFRAARWEPRSLDRRPAPGLAGTWLCETDEPSGAHFQSRTTIDSQGRYFCNITITRSNGAQAFTVGGIMQIKDGFLIDTMTNHSSTNATNLPQTSRARIIKQNDRELVTKWEEAESETTMKRVK